ncbi:hypothetical protein MLD38_023465 [Melastoma candidum]|uniref:Uncharacterized protein n=1 Tax=Melastoma candidum TaxID=119954 RepID=A0ACB9NU63_9MYRT|nr:hypothetical protein MLD38_023465 [Melastoma candidum]
MLSKVSRRSRSWRSTGSALSSADFRMGQNLSLMALLTHLAMAWRRVLVVNSSAAVFLWKSHVSPSELRSPHKQLVEDRLPCRAFRIIIEPDLEDVLEVLRVAGDGDEALLPGKPGDGADAGLVGATTCPEVVGNPVVHAL